MALRQRIDPKLVAVAIVLVAVALAGCAEDGGNGTDGDGGPYSVAANSQSDFDPQSRTIQVGETIVWENTAGFAHTVTSYDVPQGASSFDSGNMDGGDTFEHTFQTAGTYQYRCEYHSSSSNGGYSGMVGEVVVES